MADIDVLSADIQGGRLSKLKIRFKGNLSREIDRDTALDWLYQGHSLIPVAGHGHHVSRAACLERVEVDGEWFVRTDTQKINQDEIHFPASHGH